MTIVIFDKLEPPRVIRADDTEILAKLHEDPQNDELLAKRFKALRSWSLTQNEALANWRMGVGIPSE